MDCFLKLLKLGGQFFGETDKNSKKNKKTKGSIFQFEGQSKRLKKYFFLE